MKTKSVFHFFSIALLAMLFLSCSKEESFLETETTPQELKLKSAPILKDIVQCELIAGQYINVGTVTYSHDDVNLYVTYNTNNNWSLWEVHTYVGTLGGFPKNKTAIQIGKFPFSKTNLNGATSWEFIIPLNQISGDGDSYTIATHAVVRNGSLEETAWGNCTYVPSITVKSFFNKLGWGDAEYVWAASVGSPISAPQPWCNWTNWLGINIYEKGDTYELRSYYFDKDGNGNVVPPAGIASVTDDGTNLEITVTSSYETLKLAHTYLYVGTAENITTYYKNGCPDYLNFPYQRHVEAQTHVFSIPMNQFKGISFKEAFGSSRWGWIFKYQF
ncbi:MAG: hypothetical protein JNK09_20465 [Prolixibacteraceae bacterium]|nr:hypothetical protein [Prolixibacteraceae bacterium]